MIEFVAMFAGTNPDGEEVEFPPIVVLAADVATANDLAARLRSIPYGLHARVVGKLQAPQNNREETMDARRAALAEVAAIFARGRQ